jgi:predicted dinucleotide-binding enzyme
MRIAVIGTGNIGGTLGSRWHAAGFDVVYGSRKPSAAGPGGAPAEAVGDAVAGADVVLLAVPGRAVADVLRPHGTLLVNSCS